MNTVGHFKQANKREIEREREKERERYFDRLTPVPKYVWDQKLCVKYVEVPFSTLANGWWLGMLYKSSRLDDEILYLHEKGFIFLRC